MIARLGKNIDRELTAFDSELHAFPWTHVCDSDASFRFRKLERFAQEIMLHRQSWTMCPPGRTPAQLLKKHGLEDLIPELFCFDAITAPLSMYDYHPSERMVIFTNFELKEEDSWRCLTCFDVPVQGILQYLTYVLPTVCASRNAICIRAFEPAAKPICANTLNSVLHVLQPVIRLTGWEWRPCLTVDPVIFGHLVPVGDHSVPFQVLVHALMRCCVNAFLTSCVHDQGQLVTIRFAGHALWSGKLPKHICTQDFMSVIQKLMSLTGVGRVSAFLGGRPLDLQTTFEALGERDFPDDPVALFITTGSPSLRLTGGGGGGKMQVWAECKNMLGRELIQRGWPLSQLDQVTEEWLQKVGTNKIFQLLKQQISSDKKWHNLLDAAKWAGVNVTPGDVVKLRAIKTIQKAVRNSRNLQLNASDFTLAPSFFVDEGGREIDRLPNVDLKSSGVCLLSLQDAMQWLTRTLPVVSDPLAIVTLHQDVLPDGCAKHQNVTFPALDAKSRRVILKGCLFQLGEKKVSFAIKDHAIPTAETLVLACTIWKDECDSAQWDSATGNLVKTVLTILDVTGNDDIYQVWGRSFRDEKSRCEPTAAISGQFHMRIQRGKAEDFLKLSGIGPVYLLPKTEDHMSHPDWSLIWLGDKTEAKIAATKATEHSGLARSKSNIALRVRCSLLEQIAKEVKPSSAGDTIVPVNFLFKLQPVPVGVLPQQVVEWAKQHGWNTKVIKKLGRDAILLGSDKQPPAENLCLNGTLVLLRQVNGQKKMSGTSPLVAGPKSFPKPAKKDDGHKMMDGTEDAWANYLAKNGRTLSNTSAAAAQSSSAATPAAKPVDPPIAAKFQAIEKRLAVFENNLTQITQHQTSLGAVVENNSNRVAGMETQLQTFQAGLQASAEKALIQGMKSQESKMDAKFEKLLHAFNASQKRGRSATKETSDEEMETPTKPPAKK